MCHPKKNYFLCSLMKPPEAITERSGVLNNKYSITYKKNFTLYKKINSEYIISNVYIWTHHYADY